MILKANGAYVATNAEFACSVFKQALGLMFRRNIPDGYALVFVMDKCRKVSLHMLFVPFPIDVIFLDNEKRIVKISELKPWVGLGFSGEKVKYIIEASRGTAIKAALRVGDKIEFRNDCV